MNLRMVGIIMALVVALFGGTIPILTRKLKKMPASIMMFYLGLIGSIIMLILAGIGQRYSMSGLFEMAYTRE